MLTRPDQTKLCGPDQIKPDYADQTRPDQAQLLYHYDLRFSCGSQLAVNITRNKLLGFSMSTDPF